MPISAFMPIEAYIGINAHRGINAYMGIYYIDISFVPIDILPT